MEKQKVLLLFNVIIHLSIQISNDDFVLSFTKESDLGGDSFAGDSIPDLDTNIVLFVMAHRCSNTDKPGKWPSVCPVPRDLIITDGLFSQSLALIR